MEVEDGDECLCFFCYFDWYELFVLRCKYCKMFIMGEYVVVLGLYWYFGYFFCVECGDLFEKGMMYIEKDGYVWCVFC